jgi:hypothetical protein
MHGRRTLPALTLGVALAAVAGLARPAAAPGPPVLFDDFDYRTAAQLERHGWIVRRAEGWPGVPGASWRSRGVSFVADPARGANRLLRLSATTDGRPGGTSQAQVRQQRKFLAGTYAARVRLRDRPSSGPALDQPVESFYAISPYTKPLDPSYSELDFEYLPRGGWGLPGPSLYVTSWDKVRLRPWLAFNTGNRRRGSARGWHTLVIQVGHGSVAYWMDGVRLATHGGRFYPNVPMSINFNLWFIPSGVGPAGRPRSWQEDVDWVFFRGGEVLSPAQVEREVQRLRAASTGFLDSVPPARPRLVSPCNL